MDFKLHTRLVVLQRPGEGLGVIAILGSPLEGWDNYQFAGTTDCGFNAFFQCL